MENKPQEKTITMILDMSVAALAESSIPSFIRTNYPKIVEEMRECNKYKSRFFGFVIVPGTELTTFTGFAKGIDSVGLLIHSLCDFSMKYCNESQWVIAGEKKAKKSILKLVDSISKEKKKEKDSEKSGEVTTSISGAE